VRTVCVWAVGIEPAFRGMGLDALLYYEMIRAGLAAGYREIEMSRVLASNEMMNQAIERTGARRYKSYRVYQKRLTYSVGRAASPGVPYPFWYDHREGGRSTSHRE